MAVYSDHYHCYGCGKHGFLKNWVEEYLREDYGEFLKKHKGLSCLPNFSAKKTSVSKDEVFRVAKTAYKYLKEAYELRADKPITEYFQRRGLVSSREEAYALIKNYRLGVYFYKESDDPKWKSYDSRIIIPYFSPKNKTVWFNSRSVINQEPRYKNCGGTAFLYNMQRYETMFNYGYLIVAEGEFNCMCIAESFDGKIPVMAISGGTASSTNVIKFMNYCIQNKIQVLSLFDNDDGGTQHYENIKKKKIPILKIDADWMKNLDPNEYMARYGKKELKENITQSIEKLLKRRKTA